VQSLHDFLKILLSMLLIQLGDDILVTKGLKGFLFKSQNGLIKNWDFCFALVGLVFWCSLLKLMGF
jgi:hypothetical protein